MKRNEFLKTSAILGGASLLPVNSVFSNSLNDNGMDKLVDALGLDLAIKRVAGFPVNG